MELLQARERLRDMRPHLDAIVAIRADLTELSADLGAHGHSPRGGIAEAKALEARLYAELESISTSDTQLKGYAPLLLDFPGERDGVDVLWCWLEGDGDIEWYHREDCGFAGRRRV